MGSPQSGAEVDGGLGLSRPRASKRKPQYPNRAHSPASQLDLAQPPHRFVRSYSMPIDRATSELYGTVRSAVAVQLWRW